MIESMAIALWAHLFCGPWSESGQIFGWLKRWLIGYRKLRIPHWIFNPIILCAKCHAVWVAGLFQIWHVSHGATFGFGNALVILGASFMAWLLDDFAELRDKWKNS